MEFDEKVRLDAKLRNRLGVEDYIAIIALREKATPEQFAAFGRAFQQVYQIGFDEGAIAYRNANETIANS